MPGLEITACRNTAVAASGTTVSCNWAATPPPGSLLVAAYMGNTFSSISSGWSNVAGSISGLAIKTAGVGETGVTITFTAASGGAVVIAAFLYTVTTQNASVTASGSSSSPAVTLNPPTAGTL